MIEKLLAKLQPLGTGRSTCRTRADPPGMVSLSIRRIQ
ncbi:Protein of unknown function [Leuconostoc citreum]|nr:Protein of unknown function [Leuconostoc citreum]